MTVTVLSASKIFFASFQFRNWKNAKNISEANNVAIYDIDSAVTGFPVALLAAVGRSSDLESVYYLIKEYPPALPSFI